MRIYPISRRDIAPGNRWLRKQWRRDQWRSVYGAGSEREGEGGREGREIPSSRSASDVDLAGLLLDGDFVQRALPCTRSAGARRDAAKRRTV